jgi:hypothetical protein
MPYERFNEFNNHPRNTTSIDELDELAHPNTEKFIRSHHIPLRDSGMSDNYQHTRESYHEPIQPIENIHVEPFQNHNHGATCTCLSIFEHISNCPVCQKLHGRGNDHTIYILIIIILLVACGLLFKKAFLN